jgi:hypothetical protein
LALTILSNVQLRRVRAIRVGILRDAGLFSQLTILSARSVIPFKFFEASLILSTGAPLLVNSGHAETVIFLGSFLYLRA